MISVTIYHDQFWISPAEIISLLSSQKQQQPLLKYMDKGSLCQLWMILSVVLLLLFGVYCLYTRVLFRMKPKWKEENKTIDYPGKTTNTLTNSYRKHELHTWYFLQQIMIFRRNNCQIKGWTRLEIVIRLFCPLIYHNRLYYKPFSHL